VQRFFQVDLNGLSQDDPVLINIIRKEHLIFPWKVRKFNFKANILNGQFGQVKKVDKLLKCQNC